LKASGKRAVAGEQNSIQARCASRRGAARLQRLAKPRVAARHVVV
jgi:hypothetical protein